MYIFYFMDKKLWVIGGLIIAYIAYSKYILSKSINIFFKGLDLSTLTLLNPTMQLQVQVNNPTSTSADLQNIKGDLYVDDVLVGTVVGITPVSIQSGASIINIPVTLNYAGLGNTIQKLQTQSGFALSFKGNMLVDFISLPLNFDYNL